MTTEQKAAIKKVKAECRKAMAKVIQLTFDPNDRNAKSLQIMAMQEKAIAEITNHKK